MRALEVKVKGDSSGIDQMFRELNQKTNHASAQIAKSWSGAFAGGAAGLLAGLSLPRIVDSFKQLFGKANEVSDLAEQFDLSTDSVQRWEIALAKAGVTSSTFFRALETLRAKRQEAREDPTKRQDFADLGLAKEAVGFDMTDEELLKRVLRSGASRPRINSLLGRGGARLGSALDELNSSDIPFSSYDIYKLEQQRKKAALVEQTASNLWTKLLSRIADIASPEAWRDTFEWFGGGYKDPARFNAQTKLKDLNAKLAEEMRLKDDREENARLDKENAERKAAKKNAEHAERMSDLKRGEMFRDEQKVALQQDLLRARREIDDLESKGELSPDEQDRLFHLKERQQGIRNSLFDLNREAPAKFETTPLERTGAVFGNSLLFNPLLQLNTAQLKESQRTNAILEQIKDRSPFF